MSSASKNRSQRQRDIARVGDRQNSMAGKEANWQGHDHVPMQRQPRCTLCQGGSSEEPHTSPLDAYVLRHRKRARFVCTLHLCRASPAKHVRGEAKALFHNRGKQNKTHQID